MCCFKLNNENALIVGRTVLAVSNQRESAKREQKKNLPHLPNWLPFSILDMHVHHVKESESFSASATHLHWNVFLASQKLAC